MYTCGDLNGSLSWGKGSSGLLIDVDLLIAWKLEGLCQYRLEYMAMKVVKFIEIMQSTLQQRGLLTDSAP